MSNNEQSWQAGDRVTSSDLEPDPLEQALRNVFSAHSDLEIQVAAALQAAPTGPTGTALNGDGLTRQLMEAFSNEDPKGQELRDLVDLY